jgi:predicted RND superfamily exporter protein
MEAWDELGRRVIGPDQCFDEQEDPPQGIFNDAQVLAALSRFEDWLRAHPNIGYTLSYIQFIKTLNLILNAPPMDPPLAHMYLYDIPTPSHMQLFSFAYRGKGRIGFLPDPDETVQLYNGMLATGAGVGELDSFVNTRTWDEGIIIGFVNTMDPAETHRTMLDIQRYIDEHRNDPGMEKIRFGIDGGETIAIPDETVREVTIRELPQGRASVGGFLGVTEATRDVAFKEWLNAPIATSVTVFIMTLLMFRSWNVAFILISLCFITLMTQYGLGAYMSSIGEWSANLAFHVQVALSIAMGLGVDYGIYMVSRLREEYEQTRGQWREALRNTLRTTGSAIIISMVVLLSSFIPLMNTELANLWSVSLYISEALIMDVFIALLVLPLMVLWLRPRFVFPNQSDNH